jgi:hypothetical protein
MYWLNIVNLGGAERFQWLVENPRQQVYRCREERDWWDQFLGTSHTTCGYIWDPPTPTYSAVNDIARSLPDGDGIRLRVTPSIPGSVELVLSVYDYITWWKGIRVVMLDPVLPGGAVEREVYGDGSITPGQPDDRAQTTPVALPIADIQRSVASYPTQQGGVVFLGKAKFLGSHEWTYAIPMSDFLRFDGMRVQFHWTGD